MRKAQMEIIGLVLIVILLLLGALFAISVAFKPQDQVEQRIRESSMANNFVSTYLDTVVNDCFDSSLRELWKDCAIGGEIQCNGKSSCVRLNEVTQAVLSKTLDSWNKAYVFEVLEGTAPAPNFPKKRGLCTGERESSKPYKVPVRPGLTLSFRLEVCAQ